MKIDLHTHSKYSDGTQSPSGVVAAARASHIDVLGLTDHDTISGWHDAMSAVNTPGECRVTLVRGMEFTSSYDGASVHLLGYLFDPEHPKIQKHMAAIKNARTSRTRKIVESLEREYPITWDDVLEQVGDGDVIGRPHIADALVERGIVPDRSAAFSGILSHTGRFYIPTLSPSTDDVITWINDAGGKAVLAHPKAARRGNYIRDDAIKQLADIGLFGVELWHRDNPEAERKNLAELIDRLGLRRFGSSDYHGSGKPNEIGENTTPDSVYFDLIDGTFLEVYPK